MHWQRYHISFYVVCKSNWRNVSCNWIQWTETEHLATIHKSSSYKSFEQKWWVFMQRAYKVTSQTFPCRWMSCVRCLPHTTLSHFIKIDAVIVEINIAEFIGMSFVESAERVSWNGCCVFLRIINNWNRIGFFFCTQNTSHLTNLFLPKDF